MSNFYEFRRGSFFDLYSGISRENNFRESKFYGLIDSFLETKYIFYDSSEGYFAQKYSFPKRLILLGRYNRGYGGKINSRFRNGESACDIYINVIILEFGIAPFGENGQKEIDFPTLNPTSGSLWVTKFRVG